MSDIGFGEYIAFVLLLLLCGGVTGYTAGHSRGATDSAEACVAECVCPMKEVAP